nr:hypothetical protein [Pseudoalteromonas sp. T1lg75]
MEQKNGVIVCPYFDYRQLSNIKIAKLCQLINELLPGVTKGYTTGHTEDTSVGFAKD